MRTRPAEPRDATILAQIHVNAWREGYKGIMPADYLAALSIQEREAQWRSALSENGLGSYQLAEFRNEVTGFCIYGPPRDETLSTRNCGELLALNISPDHWGKGFGTLLVQHVIEHATSSGWDTLYLWVLKKNTRARSLYEKLGFEFDGTEKTEQLAPGFELSEVRYCLPVGG
ncbi:hypothetical protein BTA51_23155 [Hahella sp. CCB-MM4]|uniref:GNAT family N-acetyltransferase n=1 Tax=Hahella sp. (strain CCB-MM4) TaxID=1926491 RepID=UPI000B9A38E0|nr:GNAT family N-acetyltransferase [Hahella sp. CCB-MM4]OZG71006.1 hypothetical protein BTA51_23155 [Hahella sp. CCB-MM4]